MTTDTTPAAIEALAQRLDSQDAIPSRSEVSAIMRALAAERDAALTVADALRKEVERLRNIVTEQGQAMAQRLSRAEAAELREASLLANNESERQTLIRHNARHDAELAALRKEVERLRGVDAAAHAWWVDRTPKDAAEIALCHVLNNTAPEVVAALTAEPLVPTATADDFGGEA